MRLVGVGTTKTTGLSVGLGKVYYTRSNIPSILAKNSVALTRRALQVRKCSTIIRVLALLEPQGSAAHADVDSTVAAVPR